MKKIVLAAALTLPLTTLSSGYSAEALSNATSLQVGKEITDSLTKEKDDRYYEVEVKQAGLFKLEGLFYGLNMAMDMRNADNDQIAFIQTVNKGSLKNPVLKQQSVYVEKGIYTIHVSGSSKAKFKLETSYKKINLTEAEPNNTYATANKLWVNTTKIDGLLTEYNDEDFFVMNVPKKSTVTLQLLTSLQRGQVELLDANFQSIEWKSTGMTAGKERTATITKKLAAGKYYVKTFAPDTFGTYHLTATSKELLPKQPKVNNAKKNTTNIRGTGSKNSTIIVKIGTQKYTAKSSANGSFSVKVPKLKTKTVVKVYVHNHYGTSTATKVVVK